MTAALACIGRWGLAKTTLDDVAREARCSRATVYRLFPGGKDTLVSAVAYAEVTRVCAAVARRFEQAGTVGDLLAGGLAEAARQIHGHTALTLLVEQEPESVVPWLAFQRGEELLAFLTAFTAPYLARWLTPVDARRAGEWAARLLVSFCLCRNPDVDLTDDGTTRVLVSTFMLPALIPD
jgi:AcrR family transcriptional regulator